MLKLLSIFVFVAVIAAVFGYGGLKTGFEEQSRVVCFFATLGSVVIVLFGGNPFKK